MWWPFQKPGKFVSTSFCLIFSLVSLGFLPIVLFDKGKQERRLTCTKDGAGKPTATWKILLVKWKSGRRLAPIPRVFIVVHDKKGARGILICDVLLVMAAILMDVFPGIEMVDADATRKKIAKLCRFCGTTASLKTTWPEEKSKVDFERYFGTNVEDDNEFIHPPNVCQSCVRYFYHLRGSSSGYPPSKIPFTWQLHKANACVCTRDGRGRTKQKRTPLDLETGSCNDQR